MPRKIKFDPVETPNGWRLNIPAKHTETGKRERHFYATKKEAEAAAKALKKSAVEFGQQSQAIRPSLAEDATAAEALLKPFGASLLDAARAYVAARNIETASVTVSTALKDWLADMETRLRGRSVTNYRQTSKRFADIGKKLLCNVTRADLQAIIAPPGMAATSAAANFRNGMAFWNWSARRGWCQPDVFAKLDRPAKQPRKRIDFLTPEEARALLDAAAANYPAAVGAFAVALFAGVRPAEIPRLDPELVKPDGIDVGADDAKGQSRRHITPNATLAAWLKKHPFQAVTDWGRVYDAVRRLAGWELSAELVNNRPDLPPAARGKWSQDVMRHSCGTYHVACGVELGGMAFWFGHTGGETTLRRHYVGRAKRHQAIEFFAIMPEGVEAPKTIQLVEGAA